MDQARNRGSVPPLCQAANPEPKGEFKHINPFTLLVAVVLSAQATDAGVNKATPALFALADTPEKMAALGEDKVRELIKTIGLFRTKAKNVVELSRRLVAEHGGQVPRTREALEALPGVGRKTANVVLNIAFGEPTIAVDTHIFRVGNRTGLAPGKKPFEVEMKLEQVVPAHYKLHAHHWLILHGRYTCLARKPLLREMHHRRLVPMAGKNGQLTITSRESVMEGSGKQHKPVDQADPKVIFGNAGLPTKAGAAWMKTPLRFGRNFKRDAAAATKYWRAGADFLSKLPKKPKRTREQQLAADIILSNCRARARTVSQKPRRHGLPQADQEFRQFRARWMSSSTTRPNWCRA